MMEGFGVMGSTWGRGLARRVLQLALLGVCAGVAFVGLRSAKHFILSHAHDRQVAQQSQALLHDPRSPVLGDPTGDATLVEFFDYACPTCRATEPHIAALLHADPHVRIVAKEYPVLSPESVVAARAALAAARQGKYAAYHQALLTYPGPLTEAAIFGVAQDLKLDLPRLRQDMQSAEISDEIAANLRLGQAINAPGTPTLVADGHILMQSPTEIDFPALVRTLRQR
jgi:protein-disulfide isomerase